MAAEEARRGEGVAESRRVPPRAAVARAGEDPRATATAGREAAPAGAKEAPAGAKEAAARVAAKARGEVAEEAVARSPWR